MRGNAGQASVEDAPVPGVDEHLKRFIQMQQEESGFRIFLNNLRELLHPPKLPPLKVTSKPIPVQMLGGSSEYQKQAGLMSVLAHVAAITTVFLVASHPVVQQSVKDSVSLIAPDLAPYIPQMDPKQQQMGGGGGGGDRSPTPPSKGKLPKAAPEQFVPPMAVVNNPNPKLVMEPTIVAPENVPLPNVNLPNYGDPLYGILGPPSNGPGSGGGIGTGSGGGVGPGSGKGLGPGSGGGFGGGVYRIGGGVSAPTLIYKVEPEYSEEARKAKFQGTVVLAIVVNDKGLPTEFRVVRPLGMGLDEKAIEAVKKWRFKPGLKNGQAVAVAATIEVNFRLL